MKNLKHVVAITILATAVLIGCKKQMDDPILQNKPAEASFKGRGNNNPVPITDTIYVAYLRGIESGYTCTLDRFGWCKGNSRYVGEQVVVGVKNTAGMWISNVTVTGQWSGCFSKTTTVSGTSSYVTLVGTSQMPSSCSLTFAVTNLALSGYYYDSSLNVVSSANKVYP